MSIVDTSSYGWNNSIYNGGLNTNYSYGVDLATVKVSKEQEIFNKMKNQIEDELNEQLIRLQGVIMDLQRKTGKEENFQSTLYETITQISSNIDHLQKALADLNERFEYAKEILDGLKLAHEMSEGYTEYKDKKNRYQGYIGHITNNNGSSISIQNNHIVPCDAKVQWDSSPTTSSSISTNISVNTDAINAYDNKIEEKKVLKQMVDDAFKKLLKKGDLT